MAIETDKEIEKKIRTDCWNLAKQCFGYSYIFSKKAIINQKLLNIIKVLGLIIPFIIGIAALGGVDKSFFAVMLYLGAILMTVQAIISALTIFNKWDDKYSYFIESKIERGNLSEEFRELASFSAKNITELKAKYDLTKVKLRSRENQDAKYEVNEWEKRMGMRAALREFQGTCIGCNQQPFSMKPTDCEICGKYKKSLIYKIFKL